MTKQEKSLWALMAGVLVILFLLSSTDLIIKEKKTEIYPVSIIIDDTSDDYYVNFRKGVDKAAEEYNVDVSFITLYEKGDASQQVDLVKREISDGASSVILVPAKQEESARLMEGMFSSSPAVIIGKVFPGKQNLSTIGLDYEEEGRKLGQAIIKERTTALPVWIFTEGLEYGYNKEVYDGLEKVLLEQGFSTTLYEGKSEDFRQAIEETVYPGSGKTIIATIDVTSLNEAVDIIEGSPVYGNYVEGLYGVGSTTKLLTGLDEGIISGLVVCNQFDAGYMSIEKAVEAVHKEKKKAQIILDSYYIRKENLREGRFEKILYPID